MAPRKLLNDEQMRQFLTHGFLVLKSDLPREFHLELRKQCDTAVEKDHGNPGNNILPYVPDIQKVFDCPTVSGALTSVLGERYFMHPHRHMHANTHSKGGDWHKDSYWGYHAKTRNHRPWWAMIMYYPQDVQVENGPTGVLPGRQNHQTRCEPEEAGATGVTGEAGTCFMIHYDIWHRATPNTSGINRQMLKFEFMRMETPHAPAWDCRETEWRPSVALPPFRHNGMWRQTWNFLSGKKRPADSATKGPGLDGSWIMQLIGGDGPARAQAADNLEACGPAAADAVQPLVQMLGDPYEPAAINAAYALAAIGAPAIPALREAIRSGSPNVLLNAGYAFAAMGAEAVPTLLELINDPAEPVRSAAVFALSEIQECDGDVIGALARLTKDSEARVRLHAVEALGMKNSQAKNALPALIDALRDADTETRFNAALSIARLGPVANEAVPALIAAYDDPDRYVRGYSIEALHQIGTPEALHAAIRLLKPARWCTTTTPKNLF